MSNLRCRVMAWGLRLVFVYATHHKGRAKPPGQGNDGLKSGLSVFQVDRVDDRLSLDALEGLLDDIVVCRVDHQRCLGLLGQDVENFLMSANSSLSGSCKQTSSRWAPFRT